MENIMMILIMIAVFAFGYFVVDHFGKLVDENLRGCREAENPDRKIFNTETKRNSTKEMSKEADTMPDSFYGDEYEIIAAVHGRRKTESGVPRLHGNG